MNPRQLDKVLRRLEHSYVPEHKHAFGSRQVRGKAESLQVKTLPANFHLFKIYTKSELKAFSLMLVFCCEDFS